MAVNISMIVGIIIVIAVIGVAAVMLTGSGAAKTTITTTIATTLSPTTVLPTTGSPTTVSPTTVSPTTVLPTTVSPTTVSPTTVSPTTVSPITVSGSQVLLTQNQFSALVGSGGRYNLISYANYTSIYAQYSKSASVFTNNVTAAWGVWYNITSSNATSMEIVLQSPNAAKVLYNYWINHLSSFSYNVTNVNINGLTYSYYALQNPYYSMTYLVGYKDSYVVVFTSMKNTVPQAQLASTIAGDLP